jgi:hypothetical protein
MNPIPKYTIVICTCDAYQDAWQPLFTLFDRYWPAIKEVPIVLNTETASYQHEGFNITCPQIYKDHPHPSTIPWSKRLREILLNSVETDLVLLYLDDFYLRSPVNTERLNNCLYFIDEHKNAANIQLYTCPPPYKSTKEYPWLVKREKRAPYLFSLQAGLWRKDRLLHFLRDHESPWYFERWGTIRGRRYPDDFYAMARIDGNQPIFDYVPTEQGLCGGMWRPKTKEFFEKEGIKMEFSIRGIMPEDWQAPRVRRNWFKFAWNIFLSLRP